MGSAAAVDGFTGVFLVIVVTDLDFEGVVLVAVSADLELEGVVSVATLADLDFPFLSFSPFSWSLQK